MNGPPKCGDGPPIPEEAARINTLLFFHRKRRQATARLSILECGHADPWICRCREPEPSARQVDAYAAAVHHLNHLGLGAAPLLPELRQLWRRGASERQLVGAVTTGWEVGR